MTPRQLYALRKCHLEQQQREELLVGIIASTAANHGFRYPQTPVGPEAYMLHPFPPEPLRPVTGEDIMAAFARFPKSSPTIEASA